MNKILLIVFFFSTYTDIYCQVIIDPMDYDCPKSSYKYSLLFMENMKTNNWSGANNVLQDWERKCGLREVVFRSKVLLMAKSKQFNFDLPENTLELIEEFTRSDGFLNIEAKYAYEYNPTFYAYIPINEEFDLFTKQFFQGIEKLKNPEMNLLVEVYKGNHTNLEEQILSEEMNNTSLKKKYQSRKVNYNFKPYDYEFLPTHFSIFSGIWHPINKNTTIGTKAEIGIQYGTKYKKWNYDLNFAIRFLKSKNSFSAYNENFNRYDTLKNFTPLLFSFETAYSIIKIKKSEILFGAGIGVDWATIFPAKNNLESINVESYNFYPVLKYRYFYKDERYVGLRIQYNLVNYRLGNILDFNESPLSISFEYGLFAKNKNLYNRRFY
jgi:hypothetical protein